MIKTLAFRFRPKKDFFILDQSLLPEKEKWIEIKNPRQMAKAIQDMKVRGANLIGITAGFSLAQYAFKNPKAKNLELLAKQLMTARPTAVHLSQAVAKIMNQDSPADKLKQALEIYLSDKKACSAIGETARPLIKQGDGILTYCNTGSLATGGEGTALAVIKQAFKDDKNIKVYVSETRPFNQGSRLTFWELEKEKIPCHLICDNMTAFLLSQKKVQKVFVGADRISQNGDTANKIGTYNLAVVCAYFKVPFYVAAPCQSIDPLIKKGSSIPIEFRDGKEISPYWSRKKSSLLNPSFDITPRKLIQGIVTEKGIL